jgi:penicillin-binding protein 1A
MLRTLSRFGLVITVTGAVLAVAAAALAVPLGLLEEASTGEPATINLRPDEQRSYVYAADGATMATLHGEFNRQPIELADVPQHVVDTILAVEDQGFWTHDGTDGRALLRAFSVNIGEGDVSQGGSTVTQQLVKLSVLTTEQTLDRKLQELILARRLEREMSKEEILTRYLNAVYFGNHAYGIQAASETYFGVGVQDLDLGQAALLAALIRNPSAYNPVRYPERAAERRGVALDQMLDQGIVTEAEVDFIGALPVPTEVHQVLPEPNDYFVEEVKQQLLDDPRLGETQEEREQAVFTGGLRVYTTFDPRSQALALQARDGRIGAGGVFPAGPAINPGTGQPYTDAQGNPLNIDPATGQPMILNGTAAMASVEPATGAIRAMVGGPGYDQYQYNLATQTNPPRQVGSAFKTFVLATLFEQGHSPNDMVDGSSPCTFTDERFEPAVYRPSNYSESDATGIASLTQQTLGSVNCAFVRLGYIAGQQNVVDLTRSLGITTPLDPFPSVSLGTQGAPAVEMAGAYAAFANDGVFNPPYYIDRVEDAQGRVIWEHEPNPQQVVTPQTARLVSQVLEQNVQSGTGTQAKLPGGRPAAGKTGTTQSSADGWFVGYTPQLSTAVWVGAMGAQISVTSYNGRRLVGGSSAAPIWGDYMAAWHDGVPVTAFAAPEATRAGQFLQVPRELDPFGATPAPPPPPPGTPPPGGGDPPGRGGPGPDPGGTVTLPTFEIPTQPGQ